MTRHLDEFLASIGQRTFSSWFSQREHPTVNIEMWGINLSRHMNATITFVGCLSPVGLCIAWFETSRLPSPQSSRGTNGTVRAASRR
jgi:hypothetical protein